jgi:hypothetical protein
VYVPVLRILLTALTFPLVAEDTLVYYDKSNPDDMFHIEFTYDRKYVVLNLVRDTSRVRFSSWIFPAVL